MLHMLEWLCEQLMEAEVSMQLGAKKNEQSQEWIGQSRARGLTAYVHLIGIYLMKYSEDWSVSKAYLSELSIATIPEKQQF